MQMSQFHSHSLLPFPLALVQGFKKKKKKCHPNLGLVQDFYFKILRIFPNLRPFFQTKLPLMAEGGRKLHCSWWFTDLNQGSKWFQFKHNKIFIFLQSSIVWPPSSLPNLLLQIICWPCQYHHIPKLFKTFTPPKSNFSKNFPGPAKRHPVFLNFPRPWPQRAIPPPPHTPK